MTAESTESVALSGRVVEADVLVVDDEADLRNSVSEVLRTAGYTVAEAEDGAVAFHLLQANRYGMVLLDLRMPKLDGVSLLEALGEVPPVVIHSAFTVSPEERQRLSVKVVRYLHKPVSPRQLLEAVHGVLGAGSTD